MISIIRNLELTNKIAIRNNKKESSVLTPKKPGLCNREINSDNYCVKK